MQIKVCFSGDGSPFTTPSIVRINPSTFSLLNLTKPFVVSFGHHFLAVFPSFDLTQPHGSISMYPSIQKLFNLENNCVAELIRCHSINVVKQLEIFSLTNSSLTDSDITQLRFHLIRLSKSHLLISSCSYCVVIDQKNYAFRLGSFDEEKSIFIFESDCWTIKFAAADEKSLISVSIQTPLDTLIQMFEFVDNICVRHSNKGNRTFSALTSHLCLLEGVQGIGKSTILKVCEELNTT